MKILITGMTSHHTNPETHRRRVNFPGLIRDAFRVTDDEVYWQDPSVEWDDDYLRQFDAVIVGVAPLSSLGSNRAYGALNVISRLWNSDRLTLLVDAPDPVKIETSAQAVLDHPDNLIKDFFRSRKEYRLAREKPLFDRLYTGVYLLRNSRWPKVIFPALPWQWPDSLQDQMRSTQLGNIACVNLDAFLFQRWTGYGLHSRTRWWAYEAGTDAHWLRRQTVCWAVHELPNTHRHPTNEMTVQQLAVSRGTLVGPSKTGTWWSPRYAMSLSQNTPVFSDWRETQRLHGSWGELPTGFEMMSDIEKSQLLTAQSMTYQAAIPDTERGVDHLYAALNLARKADV